MKKLLLLLMSLAITMTCLVNCTSSEEDDTVVLPDVDVELDTDTGEATLTVSTPTIISSETGALTMVMITTNQSQSTITATVASDSQDWCSAEVIDDVVVVTALTDNTGADGERSATITVTVGTDDNIATETFTVTQSTSYVGPILLINPDHAQLTYGIGSTYEIQAYANRDLTTLVAECDNDHFDVAINYNNGKITITALETNRSTDEEITATVKVTVGEDGDSATSEFTVAQDCIVWTTLSIDVDSIYYNKTIGESYVVNVTANQADSTIVATIDEEYEDCFSVTRSGSALTITSILPNTEVERIITALNITVGPFYNDLSTSVEIVQGGLPDIVLEADTDEVSLSHLVGDSVVFNLTTTELSETIVATTDNDAFAVSVEDTAVKVSIAQVNNSISDEVYGNVTILAGEAPYIDTLVIPLVQATRPASTLSVSPDSLLTIAYSEGSTGTITITTNQDEENIWAVSGNDSFDVVLEGKVVTVTSKETNMSPDDTIDGYVTITVGELEDFVKTETIYISQDVSPVATVKLSVSEVWVDYEAGSTAEFTVTTNKDVESIRAEVTDPDLFKVSVDGTTVTVTAATTNTTTDAIWSASVFVYVGWEDDDPVFQANTNIPVYLRPNAYVPTVGDEYIDEDGNITAVWWVASDFRTFKAINIEQGGDYKVVFTTVSSFWIDDCEDYSDGEGNTEKIRQYGIDTYGEDGYYTYFPFLEWCDELGDGWYLPGRSEYNTLLSIYYSNSTYAATLDKYDSGIRKEFYWSSSLSAAGKSYAIKYTSSSSASRSSFGNNNSSGRYARRSKFYTVY